MQRKQSKMTVREAGQKGGQKVKQLIEEGKRAENRRGGRVGAK